MTVHDEQALRERLHGAIDPLMPIPAPVGRAMRKGKAMRARRKLTVAGGLAAVVAVGLLVPALRQHPAVTPAVPVRYSVTEHGPGKHAAVGLISYGTLDGKDWQVRLSGGRSSFMVSGKNHVSFTQGGFAGSGSLVSITTEQPTPRANALMFGTVSKNVTRVSVRLQGGTVLNLTPVGWRGWRWVALVLPPRVSIVRAVAYHRGTELGYSIPYRGTALNVWWRPGQAGPAQQTRVITSPRLDGKVWQATAEVGPWGYCYTIPGGYDCQDSANPFRQVNSGRQITSGLVCGPLSNTAKQGIWFGLNATAPSVREVLLRFSGGGTERLTAAEVAGTGLIAYLIPAGQSVSGSVEYGPAGQVVGTVTGAPWSCGKGT